MVVWSWTKLDILLTWLYYWISKHFKKHLFFFKVILCYFYFSIAEISHFNCLLNSFYLDRSHFRIFLFFFFSSHFYYLLPPDPAITTADSMHTWNNLLAQGKQELCCPLRLPQYWNCTRVFLPQSSNDSFFTRLCFNATILSYSLLLTNWWVTPLLTCQQISLHEHILSSLDRC